MVAWLVVTIAFGYKHDLPHPPMKHGFTGHQGLGSVVHVELQVGVHGGL